MTTTYLPPRYSLRSLLLGLTGGLIHGAVFGAALAGLTYLLLDVAAGASAALAASTALLVGTVTALAVLSLQLMAAREAPAADDAFNFNPADGSVNVSAARDPARDLRGAGAGIGR